MEAPFRFPSGLKSEYRTAPPACHPFFGRKKVGADFVRRSRYRQSGGVGLLSNR